VDAEWQFGAFNTLLHWYRVVDVAFVDVVPVERVLVYTFTQQHMQKRVVCTVVHGEGKETCGLSCPVSPAYVIQSNK